MNLKLAQLNKLLSIITLTLALSACGNNGGNTTGEGKNSQPPTITVPFTNPVTLTGAGATFPALL